MASYTEHLNLLKKNPATDGADTFNIETMLNENWDKIDEAVAKKAELGADGKIPAEQLPTMNYDPAGSAAAVQTNLTDHINNQNNPHDVTAEQLGALAAVAAYYNSSSTTDGVLDTFTAPTAIVYLSSSINHDLWETLDRSSWAYVIQIFHNRIDAASSRVQIATGSNARFAVRYYSATSGKWGNWSAMATADGLDAHINNKNNPHRVTAAQVGAKSDFSVLPVTQGGTGVTTLAQIAQSLFPIQIDSLPDTSYNFAITGPQWNGNGYMSFQALMSQITANGGCRIVTGSYVGTGTYGNDSPCSLNFGFVPKFIVILEYSTVKYDEANTFALFINPLPRTNRIAPSTTNYPYGALEVTWGTTVTWKISNNVPWRFTDYMSDVGQMNGAGYTYYYAAIG